MVKTDDTTWFHVVRWTVVRRDRGRRARGEVRLTWTTSARPEPIPSSSACSGVGDDLGQKLGLSQDWSYNIVKQVGNYGEIFERNVGEKTPLGLPRGLNALWSDGGLLMSPPFR